MNGIPNNFSQADLARLLASPQARALLAQLQQMDPKTLEQAAQLAASGNVEAAKNAISPLLNEGQGNG